MCAVSLHCATYRKCREMSHILCSNNPIGQSCLEMSSISFPLSAKELKGDLG
jgi:hypothetical protein